MRHIITVMFAVALATCVTAEEYALTGERWLRKYSADRATPVYNVQVDAARLVKKFCDVAWEKSEVESATLTYHDSSLLNTNVTLRESYDAALFCAYHANATHVAYANAACYRIDLGTGTMPRLTSLAVSVYSDPYNSNGARLSLLTSDSETIPTDCATVRGDVTGGIKATNVAQRITVTSGGKDTWYPASTNLVFGTDQLGASGLQLKRYLLVFVLMENYSTTRGDWLEGSSFIDNEIKITTSAALPSAGSDGETREDDDNDQLSNYAESIIAENDDLPAVDSDKMFTFGQIVPDYFLRDGLLYLGEMFTDHDFIEDWFEDAQGGEYSRCFYDANGDFDGDGWDNWSEARAAIANSGYSGTPLPTGRLRVIYNGCKAINGKIFVKAYRNREGGASDLNCVPDAVWSFDVVGRDGTYALNAPDTGHIWKGTSMLVVHAGNSEDWTPGSPYGIVTDVEVGYSRIADSVVELTDVNESAMRINLVAAAGANEFTDQIGLNDRGVNGAPQYENQSVTVDCTTNAFDTAKKVRLRVLRTALNNNIKLYVAKSYTTYYAGDTVLDTMIDSTCNTFLTEATIAATGSLDLDWDASEAGNSLTSAGKTIGVGDIEFATYAILIGDSPTTFNPNVGITAGGTIEDLPILSTLFINRFESGAAGAQTKAVPTGLAASTSATQPTFTWTHENSIGKAYPAFRLRVWTNASAKSGETTVYDSGNLRAPARSADGKYSFTAPIYAGAQLTACTTYYYSVSMLDAKFRTPTTTETRYAFTIDADLPDFESIPVSVKYFGPGGTNKQIRVEAFTAPDFSGNPVSVAYVAGKGDVASTNQTSQNATISGLKRTGTYYVRAFLDTNENGLRDTWETWGYGNYTGTERSDIYTPRPFNLTDYANNGTIPVCVIYMEDADTNNNQLPDVYEYEANGSVPTLSGAGAVRSTITRISGDGTVTTE